MRDLLPFSKITDYAWDFRPVHLFFSKISDFVTRCMVREGTDRVVNYLDDFCLLDSSVDEVNKDQLKLIRILRLHPCYLYLFSRNYYRLG